MGPPDNVTRMRRDDSKTWRGHCHPEEKEQHSFLCSVFFFFFFPFFFSFNFSPSSSFSLSLSLSFSLFPSIPTRSLSVSSSFDPPLILHFVGNDVPTRFYGRRSWIHLFCGGLFSPSFVAFYLPDDGLDRHSFQNWGFRLLRFSFLLCIILVFLRGCRDIIWPRLFCKPRLRFVGMTDPFVGVCGSHFVIWPEVVNSFLQQVKTLNFHRISDHLTGFYRQFLFSSAPFLQLAQTLLNSTNAARS